MFRSLVDGAEDAAWSSEENADALLNLAQTWREMAAALDAFGQLVAEEAGPGRRDGSVKVEMDVVGDARHGLDDARARLENALTSGSAGPQLELDAAVLATVKRLLRELDLDQRIR